MTSKSKFNFTDGRLEDIILIASIVGGIWGLEDLAILHIQESREKDQVEEKEDY